MEYILLPLIERMAEGMPQLSLVDEDYGQLEVIDEEGKEMYPITYPAVLIDLEQVDWESLQGDVQFGIVRIKARLIIDCYDDTHAGSETTYRIQERAEMRRSRPGLAQKNSYLLVRRAWLPRTWGISDGGGARADDLVLLPAQLGDDSAKRRRGKRGRCGLCSEPRLGAPGDRQIYT